MHARTPSDYYIQARPALFRGRLMAFKKCTSDVAWSKGRQNLESVGLTVYEKQNFTPVLTCSNLVKTVDTCSHLLTPVDTFSHLFTSVHTFSHLFTPVHTCSQLFTTVHTSVTIYALRAMAVSHWISLLWKLLFFSLTCYLVQIACFCQANRELSNGARLE